jgi:sulfite reductase alpha subunit-like flavoprotein
LYSTNIANYSITTFFQAVKQVWEMTLDVGREMRYKVGDSIGVVFPNNEEVVDKLIAHLNLNPDALLSIEPLDAAADKCKLISVQVDVWI